MEQKTLEALKMANDAMIEAMNAFEKLWRAASDETVRKILEDKGFAYPFDENLDKIYSDMLDWNFLCGEELEIAIAVAEITDRIDKIGLTETGTAEIMVKLNEKYRDIVESYEADMKEA